MVSLFRCNPIIMLLALFCMFMYVASEDIQTTTVEDSVDPDVIKILLDDLSQILPEKEMCSPDAYCGLRIYNTDGKITGAMAYCGRCSDGFDCSLVEDNTRKRFLRYKCLPAVAESSTEDPIEDVAETVQVQQDGKSWPRVLDLTGDLMSSKRKRDYSAKYENNILGGRIRVPQIPTEGILESLGPESSEILLDWFSRLKVDERVCSPNDLCAFRVYNRSTGYRKAMTLCRSCTDGFDCTRVEDNMEMGIVCYRCLPSVAESSTEGMTDDVTEAVQGGSTWPKVFNLTGETYVAKRRRHIPDNVDQTRSSVTKRGGSLKDVNDL